MLIIDGFRKNLAAFPARFCGHVLAGFVEPAKPENLVDSEKPRPCFASGNADDELKWTENSLCTILITLWSVLFFLKVRWSSERSFISAFESLRGFRQRNHRVSLYSSALRDALHMEVESLLDFVRKLLELCDGACQLTRNKGFITKLTCAVRAIDVLLIMWGLWQLTNSQILCMI